MKSFSQRMGLKLISTDFQVNEINDNLRNCLWNILDARIWRSQHFMTFSNPFEHKEGRMVAFSQEMWHRYFKLPMDEIPSDDTRVLGNIRDYFFGAKWYEVYDFLEYIISTKVTVNLQRSINQVLKEELAGYTCIDGVFTSVTDECEVSALETALNDTKFSAVTEHLKQALEHMSRKENPDYRNSIKESICAVECMAKIITGNDKGTLAEALTILDKTKVIHPAQKEGFKKLYGYTSDDGGIRHALKEKSIVDQDDAKYFLLSCTSFVNYLKSRYSAKM